MNIRTILTSTLVAATSVTYGSDVFHGREEQPSVLLVSGRTPGTYHYTSTGRVTWAGTPSFPVRVGFSDLKGHLFAATNVVSEAPFVLSADLSPGEYSIESEIPNEWPPKIYWSASGPLFVLATNGALSPTNTLGLTELRHLQTIKPSAPPDMAVITNRRPTLRWQPKHGAAYYTVDWRNLFMFLPTLNFKLGIRCNTNEYTFPEDLLLGTYQWDIEAYDSNDTQFAYWSTSLFTVKADENAESRTSPSVDELNKDSRKRLENYGVPAPSKSAQLAVRVIKQ